MKIYLLVFWFGEPGRESINYHYWGRTITYFEISISAFATLTWNLRRRPSSKPCRELKDEIFIFWGEADACSESIQILKHLFCKKLHFICLTRLEMCLWKWCVFPSRSPSSLLHPAHHHFRYLKISTLFSFWNEFPKRFINLSRIYLTLNVPILAEEKKLS